MQAANEGATAANTGRIVRFRHRTPALVGTRQAMGFVRTERCKALFLKGKGFDEPGRMIYAIWYLFC